MLPGGEHHVRVFGTPKRTVIAAEGAKKIAAFDIEIVTQDDTAVAQVRSQMEEIVLRRADELDPEWHHLHVAASAGRRYGVFPEAAFHLDDAEDELRVETRALCF